MAKKLSIDKIKQMLYESHGHQVVLIESTYKNIREKCSWIDSQYGKWDAYPTRVLNGSQHPIRSAEKRKNTLLLKYGVDNAAKAQSVKTKTKMTNIEKYGVDNPLKSPVIQEKIKQTSRTKYGCDYHITSPVVKNRIEKTNITKYGVKNVFSSEIVKQKIKKTNLERTGVDHNWKGENRTCKKTWQDLYGVDNPAKALHVRQKISNSLRKRDVQEKIHQSRKKNGSYTKSMSEERFFDFLLTVFTNVQRQIVVNGWCIDFYIKDIDTYVQFDGVYWHGLNRSIEEIRLFKHPRDKIIASTYDRDIEQCNWFCDQNLKLVRITDREFKTFTREMTIDYLYGKININKTR